MVTESNTSGFIVNIQDYSVHDGYGIRTLVFLKGCPLRCPWCQNPESIKGNYELKYQGSLCMECFQCADVCVHDAIIKGDPASRVDWDKCTHCMACVDACPTKALSGVGIKMTVEEVMKKVLSYKPFYDASEKGGVTISGGEPTFQPDFTLALLQRCAECGIHTAMETCGYTKYEILESLARYLDLFLYDIKHMDDVQHKRVIGVSNALILENLEKIAKGATAKECVIRIPLIPDFNDSEENIRETSSFVRSLGIQRLDLLPFNEFPYGKYKTLGMEWECKHMKRQPKEQLDHLKAVAEHCGVDVTIGGLW